MNTKTMLDRVNFSTTLIEKMQDPTVDILWMDEMTFFAHKNRAKRLVQFPSLFPTPTPANVPGLNITTYMTRDKLIKMHFRWGSADTDQFEAELKHSLNKANLVLQKGKTLYLVLNDARYHKKSVVEDAIASVNVYNKRHRFPPREIVPSSPLPALQI
jgi:hypothetical protein